MHGDELPPSFAGLAFDAAVNQGPSWAPCALQSAIGVPTDGVIGPKTIAAAKAVAPATACATLAYIRHRQYEADPDYLNFGHGWMIRLFTVTAAVAAFT